ncbi:hypothetical protein SDC9_135676 [bioreactor metagenome]|uniref:Uncharacterized protein n=1 Tax=bioreactor metagenome TaxID=1076179 RepID=A0A645DJ09_9ZZZZ
MGMVWVIAGDSEEAETKGDNHMHLYKEEV